jgi:L-asparaginase II
VTGAFEADPVLVEVVRNGFVESAHHGRVAVTNADGTVLAALGDPFAPVYPRSSSKPLQAVGMLRAGLRASPEQLAVVCASHSGEEFHLVAVRQLLATVGLDEAALQTPAGWPLDDAAREAVLRAGGGPTPLAMNCSGKHAGMIVTAALNGWPVQTYREPEHPVQLAILRALDDLSGEQAINLAMDGCGAPLYAISLAALARAYGRLAVATTGPEAAVRSAMLEQPAYVSGTSRDELALHQAFPGLVAKAGAEAVYAVGLPDGRGVALKISDGSPRARAVAMAGVLQRLGLEHPTLTEQARGPVLGHGEPVGEVRPAEGALTRLL